MSRTLRTGVAGALLLSAATVGIAMTTSPAQARTCQQYNTLEFGNGRVSGTRFLYCIPPDSESPLPTTIQKRTGPNTWVNVTPKGDGSATYTCVGSATNTYRLLQATWVQETAPCS